MRAKFKSNRPDLIIIDDLVEYTGPVRPMGPKDLTGVNTKIMVWFTAHICANWSQFK